LRPPPPPPLSYVAGTAGSGRNTGLSAILDEPTEAGAEFDCRHYRRPSLPLQYYPQERLESGSEPPGSQAAQEVAGCSQSSGGSPFSRLHRRHQTPDDPDDLLRRRLAHFRSGSPEGQLARQPADGDPGGPGQGPQGPLRHALAET